MEKKRPYLLKSEKCENIPSTPKTPKKINLNRHLKINYVPLQLKNDSEDICKINKDDNNVIKNDKINNLINKSNQINNNIINKHKNDKNGDDNVFMETTSEFDSTPPQVIEKKWINSRIVFNKEFKFYKIPGERMLYYYETLKKIGEGAYCEVFVVRKNRNICDDLDSNDLITIEGFSSDELNKEDITMQEDARDDDFLFSSANEECIERPENKDYIGLKNILSGQCNINYMQQNEQTLSITNINSDNDKLPENLHNYELLKLKTKPKFIRKIDTENSLYKSADDSHLYDNKAFRDKRMFFSDQRDKYPHDLKRIKNNLCKYRANHLSDFGSVDYKEFDKHFYANDGLWHSANIFCKSDKTLSCIKKDIKPFYGMNHRKKKRKEIEIMYKLQNKPNIINIYSAWEENGYLHIETEHCSLGTLKDYINTIYFIKKSQFSEELINKLMREILVGLCEMHKLGIVHSDLKPENILIASTKQDICIGPCTCKITGDMDGFEFKIGDYNISKYEADEIDDDGDKKYMSPEILTNKGYTASDIYSLGLIYLEVLTGIVLPSEGNFWTKLRRNKFGFLKLENIEKEKREILYKMLDRDYKKRYTAEVLIKFFMDTQNHK